MFLETLANLEKVGNKLGHSPFSPLHSLLQKPGKEAP